MKKSGADDINNLFKQFGGQADRYQEINQTNQARLSRERWPLLNAIDGEQTPVPPPASPIAAPAPAAPAATASTTEGPRPFLAKGPTRPRQEPTLTPPPPLRSEPARVAQPEAAMPPVAPAVPTPLAAPVAPPAPVAAAAPATTAAPLRTTTPAGDTSSLRQLFSKLESSSQNEDEAASTSSLFKRLSRP